ncbi:MAG: hypothetical protein ACFFDK_17760 [Promethearchaeota archaeon]
MNTIKIIAKSTIDKNIMKFDWKGEGTKENPIIIDNDNLLPQNIIFRTEDLHIHLKTIDIGLVVFERCQNIILEDSILSIVKLKSCINIILRNNLIKDLKILFSEDLIIENNRLYSFSNIRLFTTLMFLFASISAGIFFLSYIEFLYFLRELSFPVLIICATLFFLDLKKKRNKILIGKQFRNNEFIDLKKK